MNSEIPGSREEMEAKITALLLGELGPEEEEGVRAAMEKDAELAGLYEKLRRTADLVKAATEKGAEPVVGSTAEPLRLSEERREKLLAQFKTVRPAAFGPARPRQPSWFVPLAAAALLMVLGGLAVMLMSSSRLEQASFFSTPPGEPSEQLALQPRETFSLYLSDDSNLPEGAAGRRWHPYVMDQRPREDLSLPGGPPTPQSEREELARRQIEVAANGQRLFDREADHRRSKEFIPSRLIETRGKAEQPRVTTTAEAVQEVKVPEFSQEVPAVNSAPLPGAAADPLVRQNERGFQAGAFISGDAGVASEGTAQTQEKFRLGWDGANMPTDLRSAETLNQLGSLRVEAQRVPGQAGFGGWGGFGRGGSAPAPAPPGQTTDFYAYGLADADADKRWELKDESGRTLERWGAGAVSRGEVPVQPATDRMSVLGDVPVLGKLFRSDDAEKKVAPVSGIVLPNVSTEERVIADMTLMFDSESGPASTPVSPSEVDGKALAAGRVELREVAPTEAPATTHSLDSVLEKAKELANLDLFTNHSGGEFFRRRYGLEAPGVASVATEEPKAAVAEGRTKAVPQTPRPKPEISLKLPPTASASSRARDGMSAAAKELQDAQALRPATTPPVPQPEILVAEKPFSTFSLNVADVSFKLAAANLEQGRMPDPGTIRSEEFINAFDYRDPEASPGVPFAFAWERARYPFGHNRDLVRFSLKTAAQGRAGNTPLNLVLLLDNSGSMERADRVSIRLEAIRVLAGKLQRQDKLSLITFARNAQLRIDGAAGPQAGVAAQEVANLTPEGGTNLEEAMRLGYETAFRHYVPGGVNRLILLTDGAANLGSTDAETLKPMVENARRQGVAFDCFGIGWEGYNDELLEVLSRNGDGRYGFVNSPEEASSEFAAKLAGALQVAASDVKVQVEFNPSRVLLYRQIGYAKHQLTKEQFRDNTVDAAEIAAAESGNALYLIQTLPQGTGPVATVRVRYKNPASGEYFENEWTVPYTGTAAPLEQAGPAMRLAGAAAAFSEWLAGNPYAGEVGPDNLLALLAGVKEAYGIDPRPAKLEMMIRQAKSISGR